VRSLEQQLLQAQRLEAVGSLAGGVAQTSTTSSAWCSYTAMIIQDLKPDDPLRGDVEEIKKAGERAAGSPGSSSRSAVGRSSSRGWWTLNESSTA
jgi:hypothetical protein